jgi:hypothetical protein
MIRKTCLLNICFNDFNSSLTPTKTIFRFKLSMSQNKFYFDSFCNFFKLQTCVSLGKHFVVHKSFTKKNILLTIINNHVKHYKVNSFFLLFFSNFKLSALLLRNIFLNVKAVDVNVIIILEFAFYIKSNVNV